ncbi:MULTISPECIES: PAS domain-containing protein [unclassified Massilia]|uniref:PAS domain-containing protein n=1 Tax=unclassified Massilia TaxID=2609279 RepID=UPI001786C35E|nr:MULTISPECIES: PAS domain-containing protein [unclassified Massilia]MBD8532092.1 PAS domain-containing protein [Massilia sp. CFBP 13647]MBD8675538.1 PAS domain-containing protein [Massilia sp. CFBP 13721]
MKSHQAGLTFGGLKHVLADAVRGASYDVILQSLLDEVRRLIGEEAWSAFYALDASSGRLRMTAASGMPAAFAAALAELPVGPQEASCGRAAHSGQVVIVEDVLCEPLLRPYLGLAQEHAVRACWSFPLHSPGGRVLGTLAFFHGVPRAPDTALAGEIGYFTDLLALLTERHLREQENAARHDEAAHELAAMAEESERRRRLYETVLSNTPDLVYVFDLEHRFTYANAVLLQMWGRSFEESVGKTCWELGYEPWHAAMHDREIEEVKATKMPIRGEVPFDGAFGRRIYDYIFVPILGPDGEVEAVAGTTRDVTERKRFEEELKGSELRFRTITNAMPQMVWTALPDGAIDYHNQQFDQFVGCQAGAVAGTTWAEDLVHPDDQQLARERWAHSVATGATYEITLRMRYHTGEYRWVLARALPLRSESGEIVKWLGTDTDIHEAKLNEEALQEAHHRKDEFLAMLAHELRNPLAPISAAAQVLRLAPNNPDKVRQYSEVISRQVSHMTTLVNDLLDVSRVTRGMVQLEKAPVDVKAVVTSAAEQVHPLVEAGKHTLALQLGSAPASVLGDRARLIQVTANLLANAAKYTPPGGHITLALDVADGVVRIAVTDNGNGIEPALLPQVFDLFVQGKRTPDRAQGGLGLGLALVKNIVGMHGGHVAAHSAGPGQGSRFTVALPAIAQPARAPAPVPAPLTPAGRALRIMLVDDNVDAAATLSALLAAAGHTVQAINDPRDAVGAALAQPPDVFILDIGMPLIDGHALARQLRAQQPLAQALFVALTGYGQSSDHESSRQAGFDCHFVKPVEAARLLATLASQAGAT